MWRTVFKCFMASTLIAVLAGCGLAQKVADGTASAADAIFYKQVKMLHLDLSGRLAINTAAGEMSGLSVPVLVRVYQLKDNKALENATYDDLLSQGERVLRDDLLDERVVVIKPGEAAQLSTPLQGDARYVAVVALFRSPDVIENTWRVVLQRDDLEPDQARVLELGDNRLTLRQRVEG
ncbi:type VI secretion system lipoprotein TssJ [Pseudomonas fluorescens]|jgi:type VI secretion system protein VasD|uniref:type VI secretion system lipoprotein TssJ n=1 Tax=Pseudomonas fluorescens TaxID=294 RepID=UPI0020C32631|nr:type VI secretion system lipoprotein TssJ [Pseudomonas fluorescens]UTL93258.1 type VI secretion system lipoprotein TssJ [Pseudomonas fluorescens]